MRFSAYFIQIADALAEKGCSLDEVAGAAQEVVDSIGMRYKTNVYYVYDISKYMYSLSLCVLDIESLS